MRGLRYSADSRLAERDLYDLADLLAIRVYQRLGYSAYSLARRDIAELIAPYIDDLESDDRRALSWLVWDLLQAGMEEEFDG